MNDKKYSSLFEYIKDMFPTDDQYDGLGDNNIIYDDENTPNHKVWDQSLREDHEGDVGVFILRQERKELMMSFVGNDATVYIGVVAQNGDIDTAASYLDQLYNNIRANIKAHNLYIDNIKYISLNYLGKNSIGNQMVSLNLNISYIINI